jgi:undecaprenyl-diphosphatase
VALDLGWMEAVGAGLLQGVAAVFPISDLGHAVLVAALGKDAATNIDPAKATYLYPVLRVAVGVALAAYFWRDWLRVLRGVVTSAGHVRDLRPQERWAWLIVVAAVPGCVGVFFTAPHIGRLLHHPVVTALCLAGNGLVMLGVWWWWRRSPRAGGLSGTHRAPLGRGEESDGSAVELSHVLP